MELNDADLVAAVQRGDAACFEPLVAKYQGRLFATARRYARRESEVEDIVQEVFIKAYQKLASYRGDAPFEHWLMRLAVRTCYDFLRFHQRRPETPFADLPEDADQWLDQLRAEPGGAEADSDGARELVHYVLERMSPSARMVITLLEIEEHSVKEIAALTGWSVPSVKVRAFRARAQMRRLLQRLWEGKRL